MEGIIECVNSSIFWLAIGSVAFGLIQHARSRNKPKHISHQSIGIVRSPRKPIV